MAASFAPQHSVPQERLEGGKNPLRSGGGSFVWNPHSIMTRVEALLDPMTKRSIGPTLGRAFPFIHREYPAFMLGQ